jgi:hypothetical protein
MNKCFDRNNKQLIFCADRKKTIEAWLHQHRLNESSVKKYVIF